MGRTAHRAPQELFTADAIYLGDVVMDDVWLGSIMKQATLWLDARFSVEGEQVAVNQGSAGSILNATYGSTTGVDTNDPLFLGHTGENYVYLPGVASNYLSVPDAAALDIAGDLDVVARVTVPNTAVNRRIIGKESEGVTRSWGFMFNGATGLSFVGFDSVGTTNTAVSTNSVPFLVGDRLWCRATYRASDARVQFFTAPDSTSEPTVWTQLGTDVTLTGVNNLRTGTSNIEIGGRLTGSLDPLNASIYRTIVRNGIGGTTVLDVDIPANVTSSAATSFTATTGQTVTVNRATTGRKLALVTRPIWLFGTDDYLEIPDNALLDFAAADSFTVLAVSRTWNNATTFALVDKRGGLVGWDLQYRSTGVIRSLVNNAAAASAELSSPAVGTLNTAWGKKDAGLTIQAGMNATASGTSSVATVGDLSNAYALRIGRSADIATNYLDGEIVAVAVWRRVLTATEIAAINTYYGTA